MLGGKLEHHIWNASRLVMLLQAAYYNELYYADLCEGNRTVKIEHWTPKGVADLPEDPVRAGQQ